MSTANRVLSKIQLEELNGDHERTYLLMDAFDSICNNEIEENNEELNKNLDYRLSYFINAGATEARKEILTIGGIALGLMVGWKLLKNQIHKRKNNKIDLKEEA